MLFIAIILIILVVGCVLGMTVIPQNYVGLVETQGLISLFRVYSGYEKYH